MLIAVRSNFVSCSFLQLTAVRSFAQILRRYTSLNHLAQAARAVLQNSSQITQMLTDLNKVDFTSIQVSAAVLSIAVLSSFRRKLWCSVRASVSLIQVERYRAWLKAGWAL
jgi:hypothetical protein